jgi:hypothetical protein
MDVENPRKWYAFWDSGLCSGEGMKSYTVSSKYIPHVLRMVHYHVGYGPSLPIEATLGIMSINTPHRFRSLNTQLSSQYLHLHT